MDWTSEKILEVLDDCAEEFVFPVLDNGYVYLAATRMSVYRSEKDWAIVIEVFGFSPRSGYPDVQIYTFASKLHDRNPSSNYVSEEAYKAYLENNPFNESRFIYPVDNSDWINEEDQEYVNENGICVLRGNEIPSPEQSDFKEFGIKLEEDAPLTFEFCRFLAEKYRDLVLCTEEERRVSIAPEMNLLLQLDTWSHPDISGDELPSSSESFQQIAKMIVEQSPELFTQTKNDNTHWSNWPEAGTL